MSRREIETEFNKLVGELTEEQFWEYIQSWFGEDLILDIMKNWDLDIKKEEIKRLKKIVEKDNSRKDIIKLEGKKMSEILKAEVGRFDGILSSVGFSSGDTVKSLLDKAGLTLGEGESVNDGNGDEVSLTETAQNGESYFIVSNFKQGSE